jgi:hypothetical protein
MGRGHHATEAPRPREGPTVRILLPPPGSPVRTRFRGQIPSDFANAKRCTATCEIVAKSVDDLHSDGNKLSTETSLTERGTMVAGRGYAPNYHDVLTGSQADGRTFPQNEDKTCHHWTSSTMGTAIVGHIDRKGLRDDAESKSWNSSYPRADPMAVAVRTIWEAPEETASTIASPVTRILGAAALCRQLVDHLMQRVAAEDPARDLPLLRTPEGTTLASRDLEAGNFS